MCPSRAEETLLEDVRRAFLASTQGSLEASRRAAASLPGGDTRSVTFFEPYPIHIIRGKGQYVTDLDNNKYTDFLNNYTSMVLGHAHPSVVKAIQSEIPNGWIFGAAHPAQAELANRICSRMPGVENVRFCNSGTEAVMHAVRTARIVTGRPYIIKMEGGYHGSADMLEVSIHPDLARAGPPDLPVPLRENSGITGGQCAETLVVPFNDPQVCEALLDRFSGKVACVLIEPMMGSAGAIPAKPGYLQLLGKLTKKHGALLVFDEVQTMRISTGGAQAYYGVIPDITAMGKIIGGGFPIGAFGASREIMTVYDPHRRSSVSHSGTFNGHPLIMKAGCASLDALNQEAIDHINRLGSKLKLGLEQAFSGQGLKGQVTGLGSILNVHFTSDEVVDYRSAEKSPHRLTSLLHLLMLERGVLCAKRCMFNTSVPMTDADVDRAIEAFNESLAALRPVIQETQPDLMA